LVNIPDRGLCYLRIEIDDASLDEVRRKWIFSPAGQCRSLYLQYVACCFRAQLQSIDSFAMYFQTPGQSNYPRLVRSYG